jgi:hypothetical protein
MTQITNPLTSIGYKVSTIEDIRNHAPAVFSGNESPKLSDRYSFVPTYDLITALEKTGWLPSYVKQNGKGQFSRHVVRFTNPNLGFDFFNLKGDNVKPQFLVDNSHNGGSPTMGHMGLFRLVCANGLVVAMPGMYTSIKLRHIGIDFDELKQLMSVIAEQYATIGKHIGDMQQYTLNQDQREEFVIKAVANREPHVFIQPDGTIDTKKVTTIVNPAQILEPLRDEDEKQDLWTIFNVVQERLVKGEFERQTMSGRRSKPRGITNAARNINFNKILWSITESYMVPETVK